MIKIIKNILRFFIEITFDKRWLFKIIKIYKKESYKKLNISFDILKKFDIHGEKLPDYRIDDQYQNNLFKLFLDEKYTKTRTVNYGVYTIADANLEMPYGVFRVCNGIIPEAMGGSEYFLRTPKYIISFFKTYGNKEKIEKGLLLTLPLDENYYHWLIETLPRISILEAAGFCSDSIDLLMPSFEDRPRFVWESLDAVGWSARAIKLNKGVYKVEKLFVPTLTAPRSKISTASLDWLRNKFLSSINNVAVEKNERIYIARDDATVRHVCNATEMDDLMIKFGFKKITMHGRSIAEQARIFSSAKIIVGIHGAALANVVFCENSATLIEVFMDGLFTKAFFNLSRVRGMQYGCFLARNVNGNLHIDILKLKELLEQLPNFKKDSNITNLSNSAIYD